MWPALLSSVRSLEATKTLPRLRSDQYSDGKQQQRAQQAVYFTPLMIRGWSLPHFVSPEQDGQSQNSRITVLYQLEGNFVDTFFTARKYVKLEDNFVDTFLTARKYVKLEDNFVDTFLTARKIRALGYETKSSATTQY